MSNEKRKIGFKDILRQLRSDLIGKDSYRGVTLTYTWLANQFGHFSLGFVPTLFMYSLLLKNSVTSPAFVAALSVSIFWFVFELYNFLGPLLLKKISYSDWLFLPRRTKYQFNPSWGNIAFDTATDLCFFWIGAFTASAFLTHSQQLMLVLAILFIVIIFPSHYWYRTKMYLQIAQYPFQFRLSQWDASINDEDKKKVLTFMDNTGPGKHLFIFGSKGSGKTSLSIGLCTEQSIKHCACLYTTAMKLFSMFFESARKIQDAKNLWMWRDCSTLIIDDINPGFPVIDIVTPDIFLKLIQRLSATDRDIIKNKNIIWVLGNNDDGVELLTNWRSVLKTIDVDDNNILSVSLPRKR